MRVDQQLSIIIEENAFEGVKKVAEVVASDIELVSGFHPAVVSASDTKKKILCATVGKSAWIDRLATENKLDLSGLYHEDHTLKRECFVITMIEDSETGEELLVICGSDKRGTIYGMFTLSEYLGVTPLVFFGDAVPEKQDSVMITDDITMVSKEPSVKYRGFFINDEWPCFGTWVTSHYGDFNASSYEPIFLFLLRMKGNYMWPAMWSASFPLDGPGSENEILADTLGVVMGYSHHEPCLRASEEWDKVKGIDSPYGTAWDFASNEEGLINYWRDALKRSGKYENIITIGMRGERDSAMLGEDSDLSENIGILKRIITAQRKLIQEEVNENIDEVPQMLALYKEVEAYFYGRGEVKGLKDWEELESVICMLCEDNFGNMRTLPTEEARTHKGGFGMYYHLDYHGGPVSYEWVDSTPFSKIWDQMCMAYEYGVRSLWIVNVGDLKFHELPLSYFMALAYDYETYGIHQKDSVALYLNQLFENVFAKANREIRKKAIQVLLGYVDLNYKRRPESNHAGIYHPCHYLETDQMLKQVKRIEKLSEEVYESLCGLEKKCYYSMIHFPAMASMNLIKMHLYAGKNQHYAAQKKPVANLYAKLCEECIEKDEQFIRDWDAFSDGRWHGMQLASHIGFTKWNDDDCAYPVLLKVRPLAQPHMVVSRADDDKVYGKVYGGYLKIPADDFLDPDCENVIFEIANTGKGSFTYQITAEGKEEIPSWIHLSSVKGEVSLQEHLILSCDRDQMSQDKEEVVLVIEALERKVGICVKADSGRTKREHSQIHPYGRYGVSFYAIDYLEKHDTEEAAFEQLKHHGKYGVGMKVLPVTASFTANIDTDYSSAKTAASVSNVDHIIDETASTGSDVDYMIAEAATFVSDVDHMIAEAATSVSNIDHIEGTTEPVDDSSRIKSDRDSYKRPELVYAYDAPEDGDYLVKIYCSPTNPVMIHAPLRIMVNDNPVTILSDTFDAGSNSDPVWCKGVLDQEHICYTCISVKKGLNRLKIGAIDAGVILEKIEIRKQDHIVPESYFGVPVTH